MTSYIEQIEGVRVMYVAATAPFTPFYRALDWVVTDPLDAIQQEIAAHKGEYDVLIVLSHVGIFLMRNFAKHYQKLMLSLVPIPIITLKTVKFKMVY